MTIDLTNISYISEEDHENFYKRSNVVKGDLLISMIGHGRGQCCLVETNLIFSIKNVGLFKFVKGVQSNRFLKYYYQSTLGLNLVMQTSKGGAQPFIGLTELRNWPVPICSYDEQLEVVNEIESQFSVMDELEKAICDGLRKSETIRQSILKKAFSGQLIAQDPNDEPASVLLERIRTEKNRANGVNIESKNVRGKRA